MVEPNHELVYIGLGSNVGDRKLYIDRALDLLAKTVAIRAVSSIYETDPVGYKMQAPFLNSVAEVQALISPHDLFKRLQEIEIAVGRQPRFRWGPREIDLDILMYGDRIIDTPHLTVPHPEMHRRDFVLIPLCEIANNLVHPVLQKGIQDFRCSEPMQIRHFESF